MKDNFIDCEQGSQMWAELRCGMVTASRAGDVMAVTKKGEEAAARRNYRSELICEILTGVPYPQYVSKEMEWGIQQEPFARAAYEMQCDVLVEQIGFVLHPSISRFGCSPDGLVGEDGMIEIKCPAIGTHMAYLLGGDIPVEYGWQMWAELACTGRKWIDFVSFHPCFPEHLQLFVQRITPETADLRKFEAQVVRFNSEVDREMKRLPGKPQGVVLSLDEDNDDEVKF
jgi:hypothetical protein